MRNPIDVLIQSGMDIVTFVQRPVEKSAPLSRWHCKIHGPRPHRMFSPYCGASLQHEYFCGHCLAKMPEGDTVIANNGHYHLCDGRLRYVSEVTCVEILHCIGELRDSHRILH